MLGIDFAEKKIAEAERMAAVIGVRNARFAQADFTQTRPPGSFDAVVDSQALRWDDAQPWEDLDRALQIVRGALAGDGILVSLSNFGDEEEAQRFAAALNRADLAVGSLEFVFYSDFGERGAYPAIVASPRSSSRSIDFAGAYAKVSRVLQGTSH